MLPRHLRLLALATFLLTTRVDAESQDINPEADNYLQIGKKAFGDKNFPEAIKAFDAASKLTSNPEPLIGRGLARSKSHDIKGAIEDYDEALKHMTASPMRAWAFIYRAHAAFELHDMNRAITDCTLAIEENPKFDTAFAYRAYVWSELDKYDLALADINRAIELRPKTAEHYLLRSICFNSKSDFDSAFRDATTAIVLSPNALTAYLTRGLVSENSHQFAKALADYERALALDTADDSSTAAVALLLATCADESLRNYPRAVDLTRQICDRTKWQDCSRIALLAGVYAEAKNFSSAIEWQKKAIELAKPEDEKDMRIRLERYKSHTPVYSADAKLRTFTISNLSDRL